MAFADIDRRVKKNSHYDSEPAPKHVECHPWRLCFAWHRTDNRVGFPPKPRVDYQRLLLDHLELVDQIVRMTGRQRHLSVIEQEDFASFVKLRLIEDDYAILRKFQSRSSLRTYLIAVIGRMSFDFCVERWGRWRPSAKAERLGPVAITLERLVSRDGHTLEEAMEIVRTNHAATQTDAELRALWNELPVRSKTIEVSEDAAEAVQAPDASDARVEDAARAQQLARLNRLLQSAFESLAGAGSCDDRAALRSRTFGGGDCQGDEQLGAHRPPASRPQLEALRGNAGRRRLRSARDSGPYRPCHGRVVAAAARGG